MKSRMNIALIKPDYQSLIFEFRGHRVMVDQDLAILYEVETKRLKEQVKRNSERFPEDFMFVLTNLEKISLIEIAPRLSNLKHSSVNPMAFTEQGVAMLSSVLKSQKAIQVNIEIMRAFTLYRALLTNNSDLKKEIKLLDEKLDDSFRFLLKKIQDIHWVKAKRKIIGYKIPAKAKKKK